MTGRFSNLNDEQLQDLADNLQQAEEALYNIDALLGSGEYPEECRSCEESLRSLQEAASEEFSRRIKGEED